MNKNESTILVSTKHGFDEFAKIIAAMLAQGLTVEAEIFDAESYQVKVR